MKDRKYKKVSSGGFALLYLAKLYLGEDHLLICNASTFHNQYRRFFYRDIQSIYLRASPAFTVKLMSFGLLALAMAILLWVGPQAWARLLPLIIGIVALLLFLRTLVLGPTCRVMIKTASQATRLPAVETRRKALQVMNQLKTRIENVQGVLASLDDSHFDEVPPARRQHHEIEVTAQSTVWHEAHYLLWLINAALLSLVFIGNFLNFFGQIYVILAITSIGLALMAIATNIRFRRKLNTLEWLTYTCLAFLIIRGLVFYILNVYIVVDMSGEAVRTSEIMKAILSGDIILKAELVVWRSIEGVVSLLFGVWGMGLCVLDRVKRKQEPKP